VITRTKPGGLLAELGAQGFVGAEPETVPFNLRLQPRASPAAFARVAQRASLEPARELQEIRPTPQCRQAGMTWSSIGRAVRLHRLCSAARPGRFRVAVVLCAVAMSHPAKLLLPT
jgi:hypothetical protein